jgi:hypothetical protein
MNNQRASIQSIDGVVANQKSWRLKDGSEVRIGNDAAEIRDTEGRVLVRYCNGQAEIVAGDGDLHLRAPKGRVVIESGDDIELRSGRHVKLHAARIAVAAAVMVQQVERFELSADRLIEKTRDTFREASDLMQTRAGRMRSLVERGYSLLAERTSLVSKSETSIDGKKVLLG